MEFNQDQANVPVMNDLHTGNGYLMKTKRYLRKLDFKSILLGFVVNIGLTFLFYSSMIHIVVIKDENVLMDFSYFESIISNNILFMMISLIIGSLCTMLGAFAAANIAKDNKIFNAVFVGIIGVILGIFFITYSPIWYSALAFPLTILFAFLGEVFAIVFSDSSK